MTNNTAEVILNNLLSYLVKLEDAPLSAGTHLNFSIALLLKELPNFTSTDPEFIDILEDAKFEYNALNLIKSV